MTRKNSFLLHIDSLDVVEELNDEQVAKLFRAIVGYTKGKEIELDQITKIAFLPIKNYLKRDDERYQEYINKQSRNGKLGGRPPKPNQTQKTQAFYDKPKKADKDMVMDKDKDIKENDTAYAKFLNSFQKLTGRNFKILTSKTKAQIKALIDNGYTIIDWEKAISAALKDKFLTGDNDKNKNYLTPEYISRPNKFEDYLSGSHKPVVTGDIREYFSFESKTQ